MIEEIGTSPGHASEDVYEEPPYQIESNAYKFAKLELELLCKTYPSKDNPPIVKPFLHEILALVDKFGHSGQSGGSGPMVAREISQTVEKLCTFQSLLPITGHDEEWADVSDVGGGDSEMKYQNKRCSALFKDANGKCWYLDAISWRTQNNTSWHSNNVKLADGRKLGSSQYIKSFPFEPKTFVVDVIETEIDKDNWEFSLKDEGGLKDVFEYYDPRYRE